MKREKRSMTVNKNEKKMIYKLNDREVETGKENKNTKGSFMRKESTERYSD